MNGALEMIGIDPRRKTNTRTENLASLYGGGGGRRTVRGEENTQKTQVERSGVVVNRH